MPQGEVCPLCLGTCDIYAADPPPQELSLRLGQSAQQIGVLALHRKGLPELGVCYATPTGLVFLASLQPIPSGGLVADRTPLRRGWFCRTFPARTVDSAFTIQEACKIPEILGAEELLSQYFDRPGSLHLACDDMKRLRLKGKTLRIERWNAALVEAQILSESTTFSQNLEQSATTFGWSHVLA